jgi:uncharacterized membrane protein
MQLLMLLGIRDFWIVLAPMFVLLAIVLVGTYILMFRVGQGGSRLKEPLEAETLNTNVNDDTYWKLGLFYFNPNDPALFVEARFGVGYTANLSRPLVWAIIVGFIVLIVVMLWVVTLLLS